MSRFPQPFKSSVSHWQGTNRGPTSLYSHSNPALPAIDNDSGINADFVIVGAGLSGSALAYFLSRKGGAAEGKRIMILEAKDVASGATGRNGGHIGPSTSSSFARHMAPFPFGAGVSEEEAVRIIQAERDNLDLAQSIIEAEGIAVDFWRGDLCEAHLSDEQSRTQLKNYQAWLKARVKYGLPEDSHQTLFVKDQDEARKISRMTDATSIQLRPAGSVHSHKLCTEIMKLALASTHADVQLFTWTPVDTVTPSASKLGRWDIKTDKGVFSSDSVILCTNAHTKNFFPESTLIHHHIIPRLAQCSLVTPTASFSGKEALVHTYNMPDEHYLVQTPSGGIVFGGGVEKLEREGKMQPDETLGVVDDSTIIPKVEQVIKDYCPQHFATWGPEAHGEGVTRTWVGILTTVLDYRPLVGAVPDSPGLFLTAGFHGHGMSKIFSVASAMARMLGRSDKEWDKQLPRSFEITKERLQRAHDGLEKAKKDAGPASDRWVRSEGGPGFRAYSL